jgi:2-dehydropantoate 2-reductase
MIDKVKSKIYILGAGAIGKALAVFLKLEEKDVVLIRTTPGNHSTISKSIAVQLADGSSMQTSIEINSLHDINLFDGIVVLTNKSFANRAIAVALRKKIGSSPIVVMQNGLNVEEVFVKENFPAVYRCVLFSTSQLTSMNTVRFKPVSVSPIGIVNGDASRLNEIVALLDNLHFRFKSVEDIQPIIWRKTIANCVFNSVCPLLDVDNGLFHRNEVAKSIAVQVINECVLIAKAVGIELKTDEILDTVLLISKSSDGQLISTLQDIKNGRPTEIESLNFAIFEIARTMGMGGHLSATRLLGELTKLKADLNVRD